MAHQKSSIRFNLKPYFILKEARLLKIWPLENRTSLTMTETQFLSKRVFRSPGEFKFQPSLVCLEYRFEVPKGFFWLWGTRGWIPPPRFDVFGARWPMVGRWDLPQAQAVLYERWHPLPAAVSSVMCLAGIHLLGRRWEAHRLLRGTRTVRLKASSGFHLQSRNDLETVSLSSSSSQCLRLPSARARLL